MARIETSTVIGRPVEEVFDQWADGRLYNDWSQAAVKKDVRLLTPEPIGVGSRFRGTFQGNGEMEYEIAGYDRPRRLAMRAATKVGELTHAINCEPADGGTRVTQVGEARFKGVFRLLQPLLLMVFKRSFRTNQEALKRYLEGQDRPATARSVA